MALRDQRPTVPRWMIAALVVLAAAVVALGYYVAQRTATAETALPAVTQQRDAAVGTAVDLSGLLDNACRTGTIPAQYAAACLKAAQVQADPTPSLPGRDGTNGTNGRDGLTPPCLFEPRQCRGEDAAPAQDGAPGKDGAAGKDGADGAAGKDGPPGRGVVSSGPVRDAGGTCVFRTSYSDGSSEDFPTRDANCPPASPAPASMRMFFPT